MQIYRVVYRLILLPVFLRHFDAEVVEFVAKAGSKITKSQIKNIRLPENVNIGGSVRDGVGSIAYGNTQILAGDQVMVFCVSSAIRKVESMFN